MPKIKKQGKHKQETHEFFSPSIVIPHETDSGVEKKYIFHARETYAIHPGYGYLEAA